MTEILLKHQLNKPLSSFRLSVISACINMPKRIICPHETTRDTVVLTPNVHDTILFELPYVRGTLFKSFSVANVS